MSKHDWKVFNDSLEQAIKASALSFTEDEWMWLIGCIKAAQNATDLANEPLVSKQASSGSEKIESVYDKGDKT